MNQTDFLLVRPEVVKPRVLVVQMGARHNYAVPAVLESAGMLEALYTDMCAGRGIGQFAYWAAAAIPLKGLQGLANRRPPRQVLAKTKTFDTVALRHALRVGRRATVEARFRDTLRTADEFGQRLITRGFGQATHVYSVFGEGQEFLVEAKRAGLKIISDVIIAMSTEAIVLAEHREFPDWGDKPLDQKAIMGLGYVPGQIFLEATDLFICPSEFVRSDLVENFGVDAANTCIIPYAVADHWFEIMPAPERGRILFAGTADLRKGIHYLAMAANSLRARHRDYDFRVAGGTAQAVRTKPLCGSLTFLGRVPRSEIQEEFRKADLLVLPTLAEGSATVIYEALAAGLPVVTTKAAGSVVRDGVDGLIVPERDPDALAIAIEAIVEDRELRDAMAVAARMRAREYSWANYGERLVETLKRQNMHVA
jgi:glycosyltransferase involved in cell wall biosynthesis